MDIFFYNKVINSTAHRAIRDELSAMVLNDKNLFPDLLHIGFDIQDKNHHKACWILELVCEANIEWLKDYLHFFCERLPNFTNESAIRPIAKICLFAVKHSSKNPDFISEKQLQQITEVCFDWLINPDEKVAAKAYAMRTLYLLGENNDWIYPELQITLEQDFSQHTAAYKAAAKDILQKIRKQQKKH
ncbi:hypothetical protein E0W68_01065 [Flavobacterium salilacus subsp. salilacus]|uniref:hypothetical protein n=1 Tax=Flavobacterium TaxID=237 RepID=UPI0010750CA5|nr:MULTISPECIES: hypothetical protein [Flavobacterium]KAF2519852.1 hypothetical protein E0W68_01065 [Flavobacterium salilacus subsp. salilacus]MBE1614247.1 hypothetical protein [Flavobacterium sp. SaA2.13]